MHYTTTPDTAHSDLAEDPDFYGVSGWLGFNDGESRKTFTVSLVDDSLPEGPETFFANLTRVELVFPRLVMALGY